MHAVLVASSFAVSCTVAALSLALPGIPQQGVSLPDGFSWEMHSSGGGMVLFGVAWNGSRWVAVGLLGTIVHSHDGRFWTQVIADTFTALSAVVAFNRTFVAVGPGAVITSFDNGETWYKTAEFESLGDGLLGLATSPDLLVGVGVAGNLVSSDDAMSWTPRRQGDTLFISDIARFGELLVAVGGG